MKKGVSNIPSKVVYYDVNNKGWSTANHALESNVLVKEQYIATYVKDKVTEMVKGANIGFHSRAISAQDIAHYLIKANLVMMDNIIHKFKQAGEKEFIKNYPDIVLP